LKALPADDKLVIGRDVAKVQFGWPIGLPVCRPLGDGLWGGSFEAAEPSRSAYPLRLSGRRADRSYCVLQIDAGDTGQGAGDRSSAIEGSDIMTKTGNPHIGSSFESWLDEEGVREEVTAAAIKAVLVEKLVGEMKRKGITKVRMAEMMKTSRAQVDRLLDPNNPSATLETLMRAARAVGRELRLELV
jgi:antitoxin HicB